MSEVLNLKMDNIGTPTTFLDSSASAHTITANGDAYQVATAITNRRRAYFFDGDSDYIQIPESTDFEIASSATQNYTIDFWYKHATGSPGTEQLMSYYDNGNREWSIQYNSGFTFYVYIAGYTIQLSTAGSITDKNWHHFALVKWNDSGTTKWAIYIDGTQVNYSADNDEGDIASGTPHLSIGNNGAGANYWNGHLKNVRINQSNVFSAAPNVGVTDTITVPTTDPTADANTKLLLTGQIAGLNSPLNSTAQLVRASNQYLTAAQSTDFDLGTDPFTIEGFYRWTSVGINNLFDLGSYENNVGVLLAYVNGNLYLYHNKGLVGNWGWTATANQWYHIAVSRDATNVRVFIDGVLLSTTANSTDIDSATYGCTVGSKYAGADNNHFDGHIKNFRVSPSALYTAAFTPPVDMTKDSSVLFLETVGTPGGTAFTDSSDSGHTITNTNSAAYKYIEDYRNRIVNDISGQSHKGVMYGTAKNDWITVGGNGTYYGDAVGDYLKTADSSDFDLGTGEFTVGYWVKVKIAATTMRHWGIGLYDSGGIGAYVHNYNVFEIYLNNVNRVWTLPITPILGEWYYFTLTRDSSGDIRCFLNGLESATGAVNDSGSIGTADGMYISAWSGQLLENTNGFIDEFTVNTEALYIADFIPPVYPDAGESGNAFQAIIF